MYKKRMFLALPIISLVLTWLGGTWAGSAEEAYLDMQITAQADFNSGTVEAQTGTIAGAHLSAVGGIYGHDGALQVSSLEGQAKLTVKTAAQADRRRPMATLLSFDIAADAATTRGYMAALPTGVSDAPATAYRSLYFMDTGKVGYFDSFMGEVSASTATGRSYQPGTWYHYDMWLHYQKNQALYFLEGEPVGSAPLTDAVRGVDGFTFTVEKRDGGANYYFDNIRIVDFPELGKEVNLPGVTAPDSVRLPAEAKLPADRNPLGFIFFDKNPRFCVEVENRGKARELVLEARVFDGEDSQVWNGRIPLSVRAYETAWAELAAEVRAFGFYRLQMTVTEQGAPNPLCTVSQEFSVANCPRDGALNQKIALCDHTDPTVPTSAHGHGYAEAERKMALFSKAGFSGIREEYYWNGFMPNPETLTVPPATQEMLERVGRHGMKMMGVLMGFPQYTQGNPPASQADLELWRKYVEYTAAHTAENTEYYELWNEVNVPRFNPADITPQEYVELLKATQAALRAGNPDGKLCGFALANVAEGEEGFALSSLEWLEQMLSAGAGAYMDAVSIHGYTHRQPERQGGSRDRTWMIDETRALLNQYGYADMPIVVSEMGWTTAAITEEQQAQYMVRYAAMHYGDIEKLYWYVSQDTKTDIEGNTFGILRIWDETAAPHPAYGAKPAFLALSNLNAMLAQATALGREETGQSDLYKYAFEDRFGAPVYLLWTTRGSSSLTVDTQGKYGTVYDLYGNQVLAGKGGMEVALSQSPVYLRLTDAPEDANAYRMTTVVDYHKRQVTVQGGSGQRGGQVSLAVIRKEAEAAPQVRDILFADQTTADGEGRYRFTFQPGNVSGAYLVKAGFFSLDSPQTSALTLDMEVPEMRVTAEGNPVHTLAQLAGNAQITVSLEGISALTRDSALVAAAKYQAGILVGVDILNVEKSAARWEAELAVGDVGQLDSIRIFFWKRGSLQPMLGVYEIGKE